MAAGNSTNLLKSEKLVGGFLEINIYRNKKINLQLFQALVSSIKDPLSILPLQEYCLTEKC